MKRLRIIIAAAGFGAAAASMAVSASAEPWGHDRWGTNTRGQNCNCADASEAATQPRQNQIPLAKQTGPHGEPDRPGTIPQQR